MAEQELRPDVETAYGEDASLNYDARRFCDPQGLAFQRREMEQLDRYLRHVPAGSQVLEIGCGTGGFIQKIVEPITLEHLKLDIEKLGILQQQIVATRFDRLIMRFFPNLSLHKHPSISLDQFL